MNVRALITLLLISATAHCVQPIISNLELLRKLDKKRNLAPSEPVTRSPLPDSDQSSFLSQYNKNQPRGLNEEAPLSHFDQEPEENLIDLNFEAREITEAINFVEFKMNEINSLIEECIDNRFSTSLMASIKEVRKECVGSSYQILINSYHESLKKIKEILLELIKIKLERIQTDHDEEASFFLDILDQLIDCDYSLPESLQIVKQSSQYYVSPRFFDKIIELSKTELQAFHEIHKRLRDARTDLQNSLESHASSEEGHVELLESRGNTYDLAFTPKLPVLDRKMRGINPGAVDIQNVAKVAKMIETQKAQEVAQRKIADYFNSKEGKELMEGVMAGLNSQDQARSRGQPPSQQAHRPRELLEELPTSEPETLQRGDEMGWVKDSGKRGEQRDDIMGWDGKRRV